LENSRVHSGHIIYRDKTRLWVILGANTLVNITEVSTAYEHIIGLANPN